MLLQKSDFVRFTNNKLVINNYFTIFSWICKSILLYINHQSFCFTEYETKRKEESKKSSKAEADFPNRKRNQILAVCFAVIAMAGYAVSNGLVQVIKVFVPSFFLAAC